MSLADDPEMVRVAVRALCVIPARCSWPDCDCSDAGHEIRIARTALAALSPLIAARVAKAVEEEREAAVRACSGIGAGLTEKKPALAAVAWDCVTAIRARGTET